MNAAANPTMRGRPAHNILIFSGVERNEFHATQDGGFNEPQHLIGLQPQRWKRGSRQNGIDFGEAVSADIAIVLPATNASRTAAATALCVWDATEAATITQNH